MTKVLNVRIPDREKEQKQKRKDHLQVRQRSETETAENCQLNELDEREEVDLALGNCSDVVVRWIGRLATNKRTPAINRKSGTLIISVDHGV